MLFDNIMHFLITFTLSQTLLLLNHAIKYIVLSNITIVKLVSAVFNISLSSIFFIVYVVCLSKLYMLICIVTFDSSLNRFKYHVLYIDRFKLVMAALISFILYVVFYLLYWIACALVTCIK